MATEALVAHVVISKFCDSLPLYRQAQMLKRQGITLDRSTLSAWVGRALAAECIRRGAGLSDAGMWPVAPLPLRYEDRTPPCS